MSYRSLLVLTATLTLTGCPRPPAATTAVDNAEPAADAFLVWTQPPEGPASTIWIDRDGKEQGRTAGVIIARGDELYRLERVEHTEATAGCEDFSGDPDAAPPAPGTAHSTILELVSLDGARRIPLNTVEADPELAGEVDYGATLRGSVGRLLFVEETYYVYACGAHGDSSTLANVVDLDTGKKAPPIATDADVAHLTAAARASLDAEAASGGFDPWDGVPQLGESLPAWRDGKLAVSHLMWVDACYACSNGEWSSYTAGVWVDDDKVPSALASEAAAVPPMVALVISAQAQPHGVSWGTADDRWRATFAPR